MDAAVPFYLDWKFWSFIASAVAIILSQLPPLKEMWGRARGTIEVHGQVLLTHMIGYPNVSLYVGLRNTGSKPFRVAGVRMTVKRPSGNSIALEAVSYYPSPTEGKTVLFVPITLKRGDEWHHGIVFIEQLDPLENRTVRDLRAALRTNIAGKVQDKKAAGIEDNTLVEADAHAIDPVIQLFEQKFVWSPGEYSLVIAATTDVAGTFEKHLRFTIFESESKELKSYGDSYKFGFGPAIDYEPHKGIFVTVKEVKA